MAAAYQVYRNLNNAHPEPWSVRQRGKVIAHPWALMAYNCRLHIGESTRLKSLAKGRNGQRSVHAWLVADKVAADSVAFMPRPRRPADGLLRYDWRRANGFIDGETGDTLPERLAAVEFFADGAVHYWLEA